MVLIYVKLGEGYTTYQHERLRFQLNEPLLPAGVLDFNNIDEQISSSLNAGEIIQISEGEYNEIVTASNPTPPIPIDPGNLITLSKYWSGCPPNNADFFLLYGTEFYKILWGTLKTCIGSKVRLLFRVGDEANPDNYPVDTDDSFTDDNLIGLDPTKLMVTINGIEIYWKDKFSVADQPVSDYWDLDTEFGEFSRPNLKFNEKDMVAITQI